MAFDDLERLIADWLLDGEYRLHSERTVETRRGFLKNLLWFLKQNNHEWCGTREVKAFLHYLRHGHEDEGGRWGRPHLRQPVRPVTVRDYYNNLHTFFKFVVAEGVLESSPMDQVPVPVYRADQKEPFTSEQVSALLQAARRTSNARRDELICLLLLDTGIRASELTGLKVCDVDLQGRSCIVRGKGNKTRSVFFGVAVASALRAYVRGERRSAAQPLFVSDRGSESVRPLTRSGLLQLIQRLGEAAEIQGSSCNVHRMRRTFAVEWLRGGGNVFSLQAMLGHTNLQMTQRYLALARADIEAQARQFSPADRIQARNR